MDTKSIHSRTRVSVLTKIEGLIMAASLLRFRTSFTLPFSLLPNSIAINSTISRLAFSTASASPRKRVGTHNGTFHCDEALGCFMVSLTSKFHGAQFIRIRNLEKVLDSFFSKTLICSTHRHLYHQCRLHNSRYWRLLSAASSSTSETKGRKQALFLFFCNALLHHFTEEAAYQGLNEGRNLYEMKTGEMKTATEGEGASELACFTGVKKCNISYRNM
ncbi:hypothetical protein LXL04_023027 [Taraxacum kok-saghyz]